MRSKSQNRTRKLEQAGFKHEILKLRKDYSNSNRYREIKHNQKSNSLKCVSKKILSAHSGKFLQPTKIIAVSAHKWAIFDYYSSRYLRGYRAHDLHELSSFSKLLVFCTINTLVQKYKIDLVRFQTIITPSIFKYYQYCKLQVDDIITLEDLIHLLLMENSDQYQLILAINIGAYLEKKRNKEYYSVYDADDKMFKVHIKEFYDLVNSYCQTMNMQNIKYIEPDPIKRRQINKCSAFDVGILSAECLKIPLFREILKLSHKTVEVKYIDNQGSLQTKNIQLKNKTISNPYISYFSVCRNWGLNKFMNSQASVLYQQNQVEPIVIVLLGSYGPNDLQRDIQQIIEWYIKIQSKTNNKNNQLKQDNYLNRNQNIKTQMSRDLQIILQEKLKGKTKIDFMIRQSKKNISSTFYKL